MAAKDQAIPSREGRKVGEEGGINNKERGVVNCHQMSGLSQVSSFFNSDFKKQLL